MEAVRVAVIIVTHNSQPFIGRCFEALCQSEVSPDQVILVDAGSEAPDYLEPFARHLQVQLIKTANTGFSRANNLGYQACAEAVKYILFLNPDAFVTPQTLARAVAVMEREPQAGCLTGRLLGYDITQGQPAGRLDSTGIFRKWYGRWYDRGQGEEDHGQFGQPEAVPAACGAFMFCRQAALAEVVLAGNSVFDPTFFMYKEDIELSLRLRRAGWRILYDPGLLVYHCRGWQRQRQAMPLARRHMAAANEMLLYRRHPSPYILWALLKYLLVRLFAL